MIGFLKKNKSAKSKPRKRAQPLWRRSNFKVAIVASMAFALGAVGWWSVKVGHVATYADRAHQELIRLSADLGLQVDEVLVVGRHETPGAELLTALGVGRGSPIIGFDVKAARERIEALPWVRDASVERLLPDTVLLSVEERQPLALWQHKGAFALIDYEGTVIIRDNLARFSNLLTVVGEDAPQHAANLLEMLGAEPELMTQVIAAVRVGGRRWNIRMRDGIDVRLPEQGAATAWARLADYERSHSVLTRDVDVVDLRVPDRLIVRKAGEDEEQGIVRTSGQET